MRPLVFAMRDRLRRIELSRFWQLRNAFFSIKHRLGFSTDAAWETFEVPAAYATMLETVDAYAQWRVRNDPRPADIAEARGLSLALAQRPTFEIVVVGEPGAALDRTHASLEAQAYPFWKIASEAAGPGDFLAYVRAGDLLAPDALFHMAAAISRGDDVDVVYSDEDSIDDVGLRRAPNFKAQWSPETLRSRDYLGDLVVYRRSLLDRVGALRPAFGAAARYDLALRATESARTIAHVARVLYHRATPDLASDDAYASLAARALAESLERSAERARIERLGPRSFAVRYALARRPRVSILLPTRDHAEDLERCLDSLFSRTTYDDFELLIIDNGTRDPGALGVLDRRAGDPRVRVLPMDVPFNYSRLNNAAAAIATGEVLVLLNNDTQIVTPDWIEAMLEQALRPAIGAVGANLLYPDGSVQHAGVIVGIGGVAGHSHRAFPAGSAGYFDALRTTSNYSAVTAACLMVRKALYDEVGGLDESLTVAFNDVDFCLRLRVAGYRNVWLPHAVLVHGESLSRGHDIGLAKTHRSLAEQRTMLERWKATIEDDPYYSPHLTRDDESYAIRITT
jgi:GT2 family glycosyltransferase